MLKKILQKKLKTLSSQIIRAHKPEIIGITGSVGKTTTKEAVAKVLQSRFTTRASYKNYNNEIGLPLTIIGAESPGRSLKGWMSVFKQAEKIISDPKVAYPEMLVLEMGVDHPGDMDYLVSIVKPSRAIITRLGRAHVEFFSSVNELHQEKLKLAKALSLDGILIYNYDDENVRSACSNFKVKTISYGLTIGADVRATNVSLHISKDKAEVGMTFKLEYDGSVVPVFIPGLISRPSLLAGLAAAAVGFSYGFNGIEVSDALHSFQIPPGRMNLIAGIQNTLIIDDSYNSSPEAASESIMTVLDLPQDQYNHSWAILGDMRELGKESQSAHKQIGILCAEKKIDYLVTVGEEAGYISKSAREAGMKVKHIHHFTDSMAAAEFLVNNISDRDLILIKGSQAVRMEKIVKKLMQNPNQASELLVRQGIEWN
jgi:UDP-N-acetylmuramoyl-tripeptide--D-alanyl-D-alanine ligase